MSQVNGKHQVSIYFPFEEFREIQILASKKRVSQAEFCRRLVLAGLAKERKAAEESEDED